MRNHPGRVITMFQVAQLTGKAYLRSATPSIAINGFKSCGLRPVDRHVFDEHDYFACDPAEILEHVPDEVAQERRRDVENSLSVQTSSKTKNISDDDTNVTVSPYDIDPIPKVSYQKGRKTKVKQTSLIAREQYRTVLFESKKAKAFQEKRKAFGEIFQLRLNKKRRSTDGATTSAEADCQCLYCDELFLDSTSDEM